MSDPKKQLQLLKQQLQFLKKQRIDHSSVTLWIIHRRLTPSKEARYKVFWVDTDPEVKTKLATFTRNRISKSNEIVPYEYLTADQDEQALALSTRETDFEIVQAEILTGSSAPQISTTEELLDAWAYVIDAPLHGSADRILAFKKITTRWTTKNVSWFQRVAFHGQRLRDINENNVFTLEPSIDCFAYRDTLFILHKVNFERGLNFRKGMTEHSKTAVSELLKAGVVADRGVLDAEVQKGNTRILRRLSNILKNPRFKNPEFISKVKILNDRYGWNLEFQGEGFVVNDDNIETILVLLQDRRMVSLIEEKLFDAEVAKEVVK